MRALQSSRMLVLVDTFAASAWCSTRMSLVTRQLEAQRQLNPRMAMDFPRQASHVLLNLSATARHHGFYRILPRRSFITRLIVQSRCYRSEYARSFHHEARFAVYCLTLKQRRLRRGHAARLGQSVAQSPVVAARMCRCSKCLCNQALLSKWSALGAAKDQGHFLAWTPADFRELWARADHHHRL